MRLDITLLLILSAYIFPARGWKQLVTILQVNIFISFRLYIPRKGMETFPATTPIQSTNFLSAYILFPARGWKLPINADVFSFRVSFRLYIPRKGMEALLYYSTPPSFPTFR